MLFNSLLSALLAFTAITAAIAGKTTPSSSSSATGNRVLVAGESAAALKDLRADFSQLWSLLSGTFVWWSFD
jgi:hypothetical protein